MGKVSNEVYQSLNEMNNGVQKELAVFDEIPQRFESNYDHMIQQLSSKVVIEALNNMIMMIPHL